MTTPESVDHAPIELPSEAQPERRLHPMSWLFVLIQQLKQFIVPILALFLFGRGDRNDLWSLVAICILGAISIWQFYTYRFRIGEDSLQIRSGLLQRSLRQIPFARIHNVGLHQTLLHRIFGVAEVRLESAGGIKPEAEMRVLKLDDALALEALVRRRRGTSAAVAASEAAADTGEVLHTLSTAEVVRVGLISNRGMIVVGGAFAALSQISPDLVERVLELIAYGMFGVVDSYGRGHEAAAVLLMLIAFIVMIRMFSVLIALLQYSGFRLEEHGRRLTLERGLLTRIRTSTPRRRIQSWTLREGMLHRWFGRRTLEVGTAVLDNGSHSQPRSLREVAPVATPERCDALIRHLAPELHWPPQDWRPLHRLTFWRLFVPQLLLAAVLGACALYEFGALGFVFVALWVPWIAYIAWQNARHAGYAVDGLTIAARGGWWTREWRFAEIGKLQAIRLGQSPLDRRLGMAHLLLDTAGGNALAKPLRLRFLPEAEARALHETLGREIARNALRW
ncbi:PH domain-containing protein [Lysobacter hankyongensis]|uniref:PH domain-containing protein n=1 Tax=Lysobacter hankyongensis TaxID=1176535 RepID=A0ABP9B4S9_9GAMM